MSFLILLGLEFLSNVWNQMGLTVGKWSILNAPGALRCLNLIQIWGLSLSLPSSQPKSEFQRRVICGNLRQCASLPILEARNMWELKTVCQYTILNQGKIAQNWLPGASRVPGNILAPIPRAWEPKSGRKGKSFLEHGSEVRFLPLSSLEQCASHLFGSC